MLRFPLIMVPFLLTTLLNALNAVDRLGAFLLQDESDDLERDASEPGRVVVTNGRFAWPKVPKKTEAPKFPPGPQGRKMKKAWEAEQKAKKTAEDEARAEAEAKGEEFIVDTDEPEQPPFELGGVDLDLKPGCVLCHTGPHTTALAW
jgi:ATP-binding cassette subfamily C (CFTR/MRP) protein 1